MNNRTAISNWSGWWAFSGVLALCLATTSPSSSATTYEPAAVQAIPGLQCKLFPEGGSSSQGIPIFTDADGYARFHAVRAAPGAAVTRLTLDCTDSAGKTSSYSVDLTSSDTFAPHPLNLASEPGIDRPALTGNPLSYSEEELIQKGYGLRPDPDKNPAAYARWLVTATKPGRMLEAKRPDLHSHTYTSRTAPWWVGSVMTGKPDYTASEAIFNVPNGLPAGDETTTTEIAIWNGLGGYGTGSGLIQGGVNVYTTPSAASYGTWREYCCGDPDSNGYGGAFVPNPGDEIYSEEWYCDGSGNVSLNGGYGCTYLYDEKSGAILNCTSSAGKPCWSVKASAGMTFGKAGEFVIENQSPQVSKSSTAFTDFTPQVTMAGGALSSQTGVYETIGTDSNVDVLTDFTNTTTHIVVGLGPTDQTNFSVEPTQPSFPLYCQGPLRTSSAPPTPQTSFKWASEGAGAASPGPGECAWADRGPRPIEIKSGGGNIILGFLNEVASLPAGKYSEIGVYRDANFDNDMMVTKIVGTVTPPFSGNPALP